MHFLDVNALIARYPQHEARLRQVIEDRSNAVEEHMKDNMFYCAQSKVMREHFCLPVYEAIAEILFPNVSYTEDEMEDANAKLGVNVESQTQAGLVKVISALNICKKCISSGASDTDARNVTSRMRFTRSWDEPGVEILTCQRCGHVWKR